MTLFRVIDWFSEENKQSGDLLTMMNERLLVWLSLKVEDELLGDKAQDGVCMFLEWQDDFEDVPPE